MWLTKIHPFIKGVLYIFTIVYDLLWKNVRYTIYGFQVCVCVCVFETEGRHVIAKTHEADDHLTSCFVK